MNTRWVGSDAFKGRGLGRDADMPDREHCKSLILSTVFLSFFQPYFYHSFNCTFLIFATACVLLLLPTVFQLNCIGA